MKLMIAILHDRDNHKLSDRLLEGGFSFTKLGSTGGFLRQGNTTVLIGVEDEDVEKVLEAIREVLRILRELPEPAPGVDCPVRGRSDSPSAREDQIRRRHRLCLGRQQVRAILEEPPRCFIIICYLLRRNRS